MIHIRAVSGIVKGAVLGRGCLACVEGEGEAEVRLGRVRYRLGD